MTIRAVVSGSLTTFAAVCLFAGPALAEPPAGGITPPGEVQKDDGTLPEQRNPSLREPMGEKPGLPSDAHATAESDAALRANIRTALSKDDTLSRAGRKVKVYVDGGVVTLKGNVQSNAEKEAVETKVASYAGASNIRSELQPKSQPKK